MTSIPSPPLLGQKALVLGIANEHSIAFGCARAFRRLGAELAITYLNDKARPFVEPLARELEAPIFLPLDVQKAGQLEAVFEQVSRTWGRLDIALHAIAFAPKEDLQGTLLNCSAGGFGVAMDISCHSFVRMARLAVPLMTKGGTLLAMTYYGSNKSRSHVQRHGSGEGGVGGVRALPGLRVGTQRHPRARHFARPHQDACRGRAEGLRPAPERGRAPRPVGELVDIDDVGMATAYLATPYARRITGSTSTWMRE